MEEVEKKMKEVEEKKKEERKKAMKEKREKAKQELAEMNIEENGGLDYVHAIIAAREGDAGSITSHLSEAFSKRDGAEFKDRVVNDVEFLNYSDAVKAAMN